VEALHQIPLPVVVKPSNDAGSNLVLRCDTEEEVVVAVENIKKNSINWVGQELDPDVIIEEYLDGPEFSIESCTIDGKRPFLRLRQADYAFETRSRNRTYGSAPLQKRIRLQFINW